MGLAGAARPSGGGLGRELRGDQRAGGAGTDDGDAVDARALEPIDALLSPESLLESDLTSRSSRASGRSPIRAGRDKSQMPGAAVTPTAAMYHARSARWPPQAASGGPG